MRFVALGTEFNHFVFPSTNPIFASFQAHTHRAVKLNSQFKYEWLVKLFSQQTAL